MRYPKKPDPPPVFARPPGDWNSWTREQKRAWVREFMGRVKGGDTDSSDGRHQHRPIRFAVPKDASESEIRQVVNQIRTRAGLEPEADS